MAFLCYNFDMKNKILHSDFGLIFWLHLILILLAYFSGFLFSWWLIIIGPIVLWIQYKFFNGCVLTIFQLGKEKGEFTFLAHYFKNINPQKLTFFIRYILPFIIFLLAITWQIILNKKPLIF